MHLRQTDKPAGAPRCQTLEHCYSAAMVNETECNEFESSFIKIDQSEVGERARTPDRMTDKQTDRQTRRLIIRVT